MVWLPPPPRCFKRCSVSTHKCHPQLFHLTQCLPVVVRGVKSFPNGSAPGPSGLRPSHLREAVGCPSPDRSNRLISSLTAFINALASGQTPLPVRPYLCGATLLASPKKSGGLRPIAVGEVLRRLTSKCLAITTLCSPLSNWESVSREDARQSFMPPLISCPPFPLISVGHSS